MNEKKNSFFMKKIKSFYLESQKQFEYNIFVIIDNQSLKAEKELENVDSLRRLKTIIID